MCVGFVGAMRNKLIEYMRMLQQQARKVRRITKYGSGDRQRCASFDHPLSKVGIRQNCFATFLSELMPLVEAPLHIGGTMSGG